MNTIHTRNMDNLKSAENYYNAMLAKNFDKMATYLDDNIHFIGPLAEIHGKDAVVHAAMNLSKILKDIHIRARFSENNQIMFVYDFIFSTTIDKLRAAVLMEFTDQLISKIELFFDTKPFTEK